MSVNSTYLQMLSTVTETGELRLELKEQETPKPNADQVLVRIEATPINPSDLGVMFGFTDMSAATSTGTGGDTVRYSTRLRARHASHEGTGRTGTGSG